MHVLLHAHGHGVRPQPLQLEGPRLLDPLNLPNAPSIQCCRLEAPEGSKSGDVNRQLSVGGLECTGLLLPGEDVSALAVDGNSIFKKQ